MGVFNWLFGNRLDSVRLADEVSHQVLGRIAQQFGEEFEALREVDQATAQVVELKKEIATLHAEKANIEEGFARKEREVEHKTGLLRLEIEAEQKQSAKDFELRVQEAKLDARKVALDDKEKAFQERMTFIEKRFTDEVGYLKEILEKMSDRLPDASIIATKEM